ncbi:MAG: SH3 domain-containing protein, partial [bacterium]
YNDHTAYFSLVNATKTTSSSADNEIVVGSGSSQYPAGTYKSTNKLIVRASASEKGKKVGTLKPRTLLKVTRVVNGKWCKITYNGKTAYFSMKLTKKWTKSAKAKDTFGSEKKTEKKSEKSDKKYDKGTYKTTDTIKVFQKASTTSKKLGTLPEGTKISAKSVKNKKFVKITYNGKAAYICLTKTKKVGSSLTGKTSFKAKKTEESSSKGKYKTGTYKIVGDMKLHKTASKDGKYLELVKDKSKVKVTKVKGKWGKIKYKGKTGYVSLKYAKKI